MKLSIKQLLTCGIIITSTLGAGAYCWVTNPNGLICVASGTHGGTQTVGTCNSGGLSITLYRYWITTEDCLVSAVNDVPASPGTDSWNWDTSGSCTASTDLIDGDLSTYSIVIVYNAGVLNQYDCTQQWDEGNACPPLQIALNRQLCLTSELLSNAATCETTISSDD